MTLPIDTDPRTTAFRWLVNVLRTDADLRRVVKAWWVNDGTANQAGDLPETERLVRLTPQWEAEEVYATAGRGDKTYQAPVNVQIEVSHRGSVADDFGNLAGLIFDAAERAHVADRVGQRASCVSWIEPGQPAQIAGENPVAVGSIRLVCFVTRR
jgi:hypothetical protein